MRVGKLGAVIAVVVAFAVVSSASFGLWYIYYRPYTQDEVLHHTNWMPGEMRDVEGTIAEIHYFNTTYGREVYLQLRGGTSMCTGVGLVRGDVDKQYSVGETFRTTLHFKSTFFNDVPGVWAEELICPTPFLFESIGVVMDAVSRVAGISFMPKEMNESGWMSYVVRTNTGDAYPLNLVNVSLTKGFYNVSNDFPPVDDAAGWIDVASVDYAALSGGYGNMPVRDEMQSLKDGTSRNGMMRYFDSNGNDLLDDGDQISVHLDELSGFGYQSYLLTFGAAMTFCGYVCGFKYILEGAQGPYQLVIADDFGAMHLHHLGDQVASNVTSMIEVVQSGQAVAFPLSHLNFTLQLAGRDGAIQGKMVDLPVTTVDDVAIGFSDIDGNGMLSAGDRFTIGGIANRTGTTFGIELAGGGSSDVSWIAGYGHIVGRMPRASLTTKDTQMPLTINLSVPSWHQEFNLSKHLSVSLWENSSLFLDNIDLVNGSIDSFPGGNLTFIDGDADGFLSSGDYFILHGNSQARYKVEISVLWGYATFSQVFDPS
jgi:hypothetical protein